MPSHLISLALLLTPLAVASPVSKQEICHWSDDTLSYNVIEVSGNAVDSHFANHGDSFPAAYWPDSDGDGYGDVDGTVDVCPQTGLVDNAEDCDDADSSVYPGGVEVPYNGVDDDCDNATPDDDLDGDGYGLGLDCDDTRDDVNPDVAEIPCNGLDDDCDAATLDGELDDEGDGVYIGFDCADDDSVSNNPLYQGTGRGGENPLFRP